MQEIEVGIVSSTVQARRTCPPIVVFSRPRSSPESLVPRTIGRQGPPKLRFWWHPRCDSGSPSVMAGSNSWHIHAARSAPLNSRRAIAIAQLWHRSRPVPCLDGQWPDKKKLIRVCVGPGVSINTYKVPRSIHNIPRSSVSGSGFCINCTRCRGLFTISQEAQLVVRDLGL